MERQENLMRVYFYVIDQTAGSKTAHIQRDGASDQ